MIQEAETDDQFNKQLGKIQDAIMKLEKLAEKMTDGNYAVSSQLLGLENAASDLAKLKKKLAVKK